MRLNKEARKLSRQLFKDSFVNGRLDSTRALAVVKKVTDARPRNYAPALKNYLRLVRLEEQRNHALIESATPLDTKEQQAVASDVHKRFGSHLTTEFKTDPALLGGLRIQVGSDVWDGSVRNRLDRLQNQL